jgi:hypothetical protein
MHECVHAQSDVVRLLREPADLRGSTKRLYAMGHEQLRRAPDVHADWRRSGGYGIVHLQRERLHAGRYHLPGHPDTRDLRERRELLLRAFDVALHHAHVMLGDGAQRGVRAHLHQ